MLIEILASLPWPSPHFAGRAIVIIGAMLLIGLIASPHCRRQPRE